MANAIKLVEIDQFREKLIDMINTARDARTGQDLAERIADYLVANGVTIPVRCEDCAYCDISYPTGKPTPWYLCKRNRWTVTKADDFCPYGERRCDNG
jgi:hypothetical protein